MRFEKNWDEHVAHAEEIARSPAFGALRDEILARAAPRPDEEVVDLGAGTGLLALAAAGRSRRVWAVDVSPRMGEYLGAKARSAGLTNIDVVTASLTSLPLADGLADVIVSNYCFHHLRDEDKHRALSEVARVLAPGGRLVIGDMMFRMGIAAPRDRRVLAQKVRLMLARGIPGLVRLARNLARQATGRGEHPAGAAWWRAALEAQGLDGVEVRLLAHEGGTAVARKRAAAVVEVSPTAGAARRARPPAPAA